MTAKDLQEMILKLPKGSFQKMIWSRELKLYKKFENQNIKITKVSEGTVRFGVEYDNMKAVQEKRENGELPQDNQGLNGMEWIFYPYLLKGKNGKEYLRVNTIKGNPIKTKYFMNGEEITKEQAEEYCTANNFSKGGNPLEVFNVGIENIIQVGKVA